MQRQRNSARIAALNLTPKLKTAKRMNNSVEALKWPSTLIDYFYYAANGLIFVFRRKSIDVNVFNRNKPAVEAKYSTMTRANCPGDRDR